MLERATCVLVNYSSFSTIRVEALGFKVGKTARSFWLATYNIESHAGDSSNDLSAAVVIYLYRAEYDVSVL